MPIFGRSKKEKSSNPTSQQQSSAKFYQQPSYQTTTQIAVNSRPNWGYGEQGQSNSQVYGQPQGWPNVPVPSPYQPLLIQQNYFIPPSYPQGSGQLSGSGSGSGSTLNLTSMTNLLVNGMHEHGMRFVQNEVTPLYLQGTQYINRGGALCDTISSKFNAVITSIDEGKFSGDERDLTLREPRGSSSDFQQELTANRGLEVGRLKGIVSPVSLSTTSTNYFAKVHLYANSRLPLNLSPLKLYVATFPLLCAAAENSFNVYSTPTGKERENHVDADWRSGTKAMVIKSIPMDEMNTIVFAIRGSQSILDWSVNFKSAPASPEGFLDDAGNLCHAGFLNVAKKMIKPVAARLRSLLEEDPGRSKCCLLITGHSAGGAIAALLYMHMLSTSKEAESELNILTGFFKRIHCISFGAPPVSLLPLQTPKSTALRKSLFFSFVNEGDPVARAEKAYVRSLIDLYASPPPGQSCVANLTPPKLQPLVSSLKNSSSSFALNKIRPAPPKASKTAPAPTVAPKWPIPQATLSNAGRIILLRSVQRADRKGNKKKNTNEMMNEGVIAQVISDEILRDVLWGDPVNHMMGLYSRRIEILATNAVTGRF